MESFINNVRNWLITNISMVMEGLILPVSGLVLVVISIICFITGFIRMKKDKDDFKGRFVAGIFCLGGAVLLTSLWIWGRAAAGV